MLTYWSGKSAQAMTTLESGVSIRNELLINNYRATLRPLCAYQRGTILESQAERGHKLARNQG
jgi:hypothetical protein